jgi:hypothetical protein
VPFGHLPPNWKGQSSVSAHPFVPSFGHAATAIPCQRFSREKSRLPSCVTRDESFAAIHRGATFPDVLCVRPLNQSRDTGALLRFEAVGGALASVQECQSLPRPTQEPHP